MTAPTMEQVHAWAEQTQLSHFACYVIPGFGHRLQRFAELAAGQSGQASGSGAPVAADKIVDEYAEEYEFDDGEGFHTPTEQEGALLVDFGHGLVARLQEAGLLAAVSSGSGAELVREIEADVGALKTYVDVYKIATCKYIRESPYWDRLKAALISGDAAREDAARLSTAHESVLRSLQKKAPRFEDTDRLDAIESQSWCVGKYESNRFYVHLGQINDKQCETTGATLREAIDRARGGK